MSPPRMSSTRVEIPMVPMLKNEGLEVDRRQLRYPVARSSAGVAPLVAVERALGLDARTRCPRPRQFLLVAPCADRQTGKERGPERGRLEHRRDLDGALGRVGER